MEFLHPEWAKKGGSTKAKRSASVTMPIDDDLRPAFRKYLESKDFAGIRPNLDESENRIKVQLTRVVGYYCEEVLFLLGDLDS